MLADEFFVLDYFRALVKTLIVGQFLDRPIVFIDLIVYLFAVHSLSGERIEPGTAGWEVRLLPMCFAVPLPTA